VFVNSSNKFVFDLIKIQACGLFTRLLQGFSLQ
jgi:hypothetical protein